MWQKGKAQQRIAPTRMGWMRTYAGMGTFSASPFLASCFKWNWQTWLHKGFILLSLYIYIQKLLVFFLGKNDTHTCVSRLFVMQIPMFFLLTISVTLLAVDMSLTEAQGVHTPLASVATPFLKLCFLQAIRKSFSVCFFFSKLCYLQ